MVTVTIEIEYCNDCPFANKKYRQVGLSTREDYVVDYVCKKTDKEIATVDIADRVKIPSFCPFNQSLKNRSHEKTGIAY